ncbi:MAG: hypothetical protein EOS04_21585 [Mesorhizobium sp.]|nr:MAG: hypothetical protein EOR98_26245 [Mesorhizobium sp.]RWN72169.1 MAG: hypothetical protein EOS02_28145 [Mesorhizobium sp.]RWN73390.1 MAG: hypothetical protein EOS01_26290 [Mesorhizobium sp.]RWN85701.1 MAG: hypothetical protein EOS04_21585 [Mesorhizobium sp.]RWO09431.1 MAG: hypothetical protein EOS15_27120 [Mesorhizobium sp.]
MPRRRGKSGFLSTYTVDDTYLLKPDRARGQPGMLRGRNPSANDVLIKFWPRQKASDDQDLELIWRSEIRQLQRLAALPRADDLFVHMVGSGKDSDGFYLVLDPGLASPLEMFLAASRKHELLAQVRQPRARRIMWGNVRRLVEALELLHSQGAIHRNLDPWAVITSLSDEPDFRITGFEWSMRIAAVDATENKKIKAPRVDDSYSFARDWRDLAHLAGIVLDIPSAPLADLRIVPSRVAEHASATEIRLLRSMLGLEPVERLDGEFILKRIDEIIDGISAEAAGRDARLCLSVRLGTGSPLSEAIRRASGNEIEITEEIQQIRFMLDDLGRHGQLVAVRDNSTAEARFVLVGNRLTYRLAPYRRPGSTESGNWEFAYCERADGDPPHPATIVGDTAIDTDALDIVRNVDATQSFPRRRGKVQRWEDYTRRTVAGLARKSDLERMHQSFALLLILEMAYAAADIFPVEIISRSNAGRSDQQAIRLVSRHDPDRAKLSTSLGLDAPAVRLTKMLNNEEMREDGAWTLTEPGMLGERSTPTTSWRFAELEDVNDIECMKFEGTSLPQHRSTAYLAPSEMIGRIAQFKRRLKALGALREHGELLRMLVDPRNRIEDSHDPLDETSAAFQDLDSSKQQALREILSVIPLFLLQGPPGVGKTYLVGDLVRRRFDDEPITRILLSAQSNSAIDHLMSEVQTTFADVASDERPLMVRARSADDDEASGELEIDVQAGKLLQDLAGSELVEEAAPHLTARVRSLAEMRARGGARRISSTGGRRMSAELRAFEGMILRAANLVFATTNSAAIERLIEERSLFDWTIIEEAGKATGGELLSPLLLSHRRLMIGDHKQLPPFDLDTITKLLSSTENVKNVVSLVDDLVSRYLKDPGIDEIFREIEGADDDFGRSCADALAVLTLFENFVEREFARQKKRDQGSRIARRLNEQYRMHPAIAQIVSRCFYDGELKTNPKQEKKFLSSPAPVLSADAKRLPDTPVVFIDMPYVREERPGGRAGEKLPPWSNPDEVQATIRTLELLRSGSKTYKPSLAVLSPYWQQVNRIGDQIAKRRDGALAHLENFVPAIGDQEFCGTVDSFQGGEADAVIVSLVRNNHHSTPARALGFLRDNRRMNVLLSRAKWRLILIGSLSFYRNIVKIAEKLPDQDIGFLSELLRVLEEEAAAKQAEIIPWATLRGGPA